MTDRETAGTLTSQRDLPRGQEGVARRLIRELNASDEIEKEWRKEVADIEQRYRNDSTEAENGFNILASNIATLEPALYNQTPKPDIRRRHRDKDEAGKNLAMVAERAIVSALDDLDFDAIMEAAVNDYALVGRGVSRLKYVPTTRPTTPIEREDIATGEQIDLIERSEDGPDLYQGLAIQSDDIGLYVEREGEPYDQVVWEEVRIEPVAWDDFRRSAARSWDQVEWVAFRHFMTKDEIAKTFGKAISERLPWVVTEDKPTSNYEQKGPDEEPVLTQTEVWEVWDKSERKVCWIHKEFPDRPLKSEDAPLNLTGFFPIPRPLYSVPSRRTLVPVPEYRLYKKQAEELDKLTKRIDKLVDALQVRGVYDSTIAEIERMLDEDEATLIPAQAAAKWAEKAGGLDNAITYWPIRVIAEVLTGLYSAREQVKQTIYEITGLSDILRGASDSKETATAQRIKGQFGSLRLNRRQALVQRYARDIIRMMVEIMVENFDVRTVEAMAGMAIEPAAWQIAQQDSLRSWRIDIETDSTVAPDEDADQRNVTELFSGLTAFMGEVLPAVAQGLVPPEVAQTLMMTAVRRFKLSREIEDVLEAWGEQAQQQGQGQQEDPSQAAEQQAAMAKAELEQQKATAEIQKMQREAEADQTEHVLRMRELQMKAEAQEMEHRVKMDGFMLKVREMQNAPSTEAPQ